MTHLFDDIEREHVIQLIDKFTPISKKTTILNVPIVTFGLICTSRVHSLTVYLEKFKNHGKCKKLVH